VCSNFQPTPTPTPTPSTLFAADLTIMEEGTELLHRLEAKAAEMATKPPPAEGEHPISMPMFTSCCPGWIALVEKSNPELIPYLSGGGGGGGGVGVGAWG